MKFILGKKQKMTQFFDEKGKVFPATLVLAEPNTVTLVRTKEKDGYKAVQVLSGKKKREFRSDETGEVKGGDKIDVSIFSAGDKIRISGISKGKGFQGVVKRHGFKGGPRSHGQKHSEREPGSIGSTGPQRVFKGVRMAGRMGSDRVTVKNLKVLKVDKEANEILVSGAVPGRRGTLLEIYGI
ncbi:50S ribosomal protein L3 [Patescibacteria group bacterium]|nr:50S ribosomal protein L3 [Patescibacteria group bacterium]